MVKTTKTTTKKRTQVKDLSQSKRDLNKQEMSDVKGGLRQKKQVTKMKWEAINVSVGATED